MHRPTRERVLTTGDRPVVSRAGVTPPVAESIPCVFSPQGVLLPPNGDDEQLDALLPRPSSSSGPPLATSAAPVASVSTGFAVRSAGVPSWDPCGATDLSLRGAAFHDDDARWCRAWRVARLPARGRGHSIRPRALLLPGPRRRRKRDAPHPAAQGRRGRVGSLRRSPKAPAPGPQRGARPFHFPFARDRRSLPEGRSHDRAPVDPERCRRCSIPPFLAEARPSAARRTAR